MWALKSAEQRGDKAKITYSRTVTVNEEEIEETYTVRHERASFSGVQQTLPQWKANMRREITADLSDLNKEDSEPTPVDITGDVRARSR